MDAQAPADATTRARQKPCVITIRVSGVELLITDVFRARVGDLEVLRQDAGDQQKPRNISADILRDPGHSGAIQMFVIVRIGNRRFS